MNDGHLVVAYHGCDITTRDDLVAGRTQPKSSQNRYDWLGPGFYLFEGDAERAQAFADTASLQPTRRLTAKPIANAAVVGCLISLQRCLDMTTRLGLFEFEKAFEAFSKGYEDSAQDKMPVNRAAGGADTDVLLRHLDNAVFSFIHVQRDKEAADIHYQAVRGAFRQGAALAENSGFYRDSHVQIALRDPRCIRGWFLLPGDELLSEEAYASAVTDLEAAKATYTKPRKRVG